MTETEPSYTISSVDPCNTVDDADTNINVTKATLEITLGGERRKLAAFQWRKGDLTERDVEAVIFLSHGYAEYLSSYYEVLAVSLAKNFNVAVIGHDHLGHGRSDGPQALPVVDFETDYVVPIIEHINHVNENIFSHRPVFIVAHSMGGLMTVLTLLKEPSLAKGAVLIGPLLEMDPSKATPFMVLLGKILGSILPWLPLKGLDLNEVTRDEKAVEDMMKDGLRYMGGLKAKMAKEMLAGIERVATADKAKFKAAMLVVLGEQDTICYPKGTKSFFDALLVEDKEYKEYPDARHNLLMELKETREALFHDIKLWIGDRIGGQM